MARRKRKDGHFIAGLVGGGDGEVRVTKGENFVVGGGAKERHEQAVDFVTEVDKEFRKDPPQTPGELRMIVRDAAKKAGLESKPKPKAE